jgi:hypothetical protein
MSEKRNGKRFRHHTEWLHMADVVIEAIVSKDVWRRDR